MEFELDHGDIRSPVEVDFSLDVSWSTPLPSITRDNETCNTVSDFVSNYTGTMDSEIRSDPMEGFFLRSKISQEA